MPDQIIAIIVILGLVLLFMIPNFKIVRINEVKIVERLGKFHKLLDTPGIHFIVPLIDRDIQTVNLEKQHIKTKLKLEINEISVDVLLSYDMRVIDPKTFVYAALDSMKVIHEYILSALESDIDYDTIIDETIPYAVEFGVEIENMQIK